jgi:5-methylcytosine-specific restriction protein B
VIVILSLQHSSQEENWMPEVGPRAIFNLAHQFRQRCLSEGRSLLWPDRSAWNLSTIDELVAAFIEKPLLGAGTFVEKWSKQLASSAPDVHCVAADVLTFYYLFPDNIGAEAKLTAITTVASWKLGSVPDSGALQEALSGIGRPGLHYTTARDWQVAYYLAFAREVISSGADATSRTECQTLADKAKLTVRNWKQARKPDSHYQMHEGEAARNILLFLLFPQHYEAIASESHKKRILERYKPLADGAVDTDDALLAIRGHLTPRFGEGFSYYSESVQSDWDPDYSPSQPTLPNIWIEKTDVSGHVDRETGDLRVGSALWSPTTDKVGGDIYRFMRDVRSGDIILHLEDKKAITAHSKAAGSATTDFTCPTGTQWSDRPGYLIRLTGFTRLSPALRRETIFADQFAERLLDLLEGGTKNLFYNRDLTLNQGGYLTPVPPELLAILDDAYEEVAGTTLTKLVAANVPSTDPWQAMIELTFMSHADLEGLEELIRLKRQVILQGPPGAGKTYVAELMARHLTDNPLTDEGHNDRLAIVQFHQSYAYEDFIQGIRPETRNDHIEYHVRDGIFKELTDRATKDPQHTYVMLIDEINRGNMARIFGELLYLLEYRTKDVLLAYPDEAGNRRFSIPDNLYIIGTMNTTDRSLAQIDYALRRRFYFYDLPPMVGGTAPVLEAWLAKQAFVPAVQQLVLKLFIALNERLTATLGDDYLIGHSYFMTPTVATDEGRRSLWRHAIVPLLTEYFFNKRDLKETLQGYSIDSLLAGPPSA